MEQIKVCWISLLIAGKQKITIYNWYLLNQAMLIKLSNISGPKLATESVIKTVYKTVFMVPILDIWERKTIYTLKYVIWYLGLLWLLIVQQVLFGDI